LRGARIASPAPSSKEDGFPDPKRLPSTGAPKPRCSRTSTGLEGTRHRSRGFATDEPASGALSPLRRSRAEWLDPFIVVRRLFAFGREGPRAACRLLQSIRSREHDHGWPEPRMTPPAVARRCSRSRDHDLSIVALSCGWQRLLSRTRPVEMSRARGLAEVSLPRLGASQRDLSRGELRPNPIGSDTSCRSS
jgi:hypothetical protein